MIVYHSAVWYVQGRLKPHAEVDLRDEMTREEELKNC